MSLQFDSTNVMLVNYIGLSTEDRNTKNDREIVSDCSPEEPEKPNQLVDLLNIVKNFLKS